MSYPQLKHKYQLLNLLNWLGLLQYGIPNFGALLYLPYVLLLHVLIHSMSFQICNFVLWCCLCQTKVWRPPLVYAELDHWSCACWHRLLWRQWNKTGLSWWRWWLVWLSRLCLHRWRLGTTVFMHQVCVCCTVVYLVLDCFEFLHDCV